MNVSLNFSKQNNGIKNSIFDSHQIIDWYDGAILGIGMERITNSILLYGLMAHDYETRLRIFALTSIDKKLNDKLNIIIGKNQQTMLKETLLSFYSNISSNATYLMKAYTIDDTDYKIIQVNANEIKYFPDAESVYNQSKKATKRWFDFFL